MNLKIFYLSFGVWFNNMERLILASSSPRRRDLLNSIGVKFEVIESNFDESILERRKIPTEFVTASAYGKASDVFDRTDHGIVLAADTVLNILYILWVLKQEH